MDDGSGWYQVAICEEGLKNDAVMGYFGIIPKSWGDHDGVPYAGGDSWAAQELYANSLNGGHAPWAPVNCAAGGYKGW